MNNCHYSELDIVSWLTSNGRFPAELYFTFGSVIYRWIPDPGGFISMHLRDKSRHAACLAYLDAVGRRFSDLEELERFGEAHHWPNLPKFLTNMAAWQERRRQRFVK